MKKNILKIIFLSLFIITCQTFVSHAKASAATWCGVLAYAPTGNCLDGQDYTALTSLHQSDSSDTLKSKFITKMHGFEAGQSFQRIGAAYIEDGLGGANWEI